MSVRTNLRSKTIVLVTDQFQCERLIKAGKVLADLTDTELCVFNVQSGKYPQNPVALEHLYNVSKAGGAVMNIAYGGEPVKQIISFIKHSKASNVVTGCPQNEDSVMYTIWRKFTHIKFFTVDGEGHASEITRADIPAASGVSAAIVK